MALKEKCAICSEPIEKKYLPMQEWSISGSLCGRCYSKKIKAHYPGKHARVNEDQ